MKRQGAPAPKPRAVSTAYASVPPEAAREAAKPNRFRQIAKPVLAIRDPNALTFFHYFAFLYVVLYVSRFIEFLPGALRPILVFSIVLLGGALISGRILTLFSTTAGKWMLGFIFWLGVSSVFSTWPGQSVKLTIDMYKVLLTAMVVVAFSSSMRAAFGMVLSAGLGLGLAGCYPFFAGGAIIGDRLVVDTGGGGTMADPNFFAVFLVVGMPLLAFCFLHFQKLSKLIPLALLPVVFYSFIRTGSRSGMVALVGMLLFVFWQVPARQKAKLLMLGGVGLAGLLALAPSNLLLRYISLLKPEAATSRAQTEEEAKELERAEGSAEGRKHLMKQAILLTLHNPVFGVGAGMFATAEQDFAIEVQGMERGARHTTHNTPLQASAETGIPGFLCFMAVLFTVYRNLSRLRMWCRRLIPTPQVRNVERGLLALQAALIAFYIELFFLSMLLAGFAWLILSIGIAFAEAARQELARQASSAAGSEQAPPANVLERPGVVLTKDFAGVRQVAVQSAGKQLVGPAAVRRIAGNRPVPGVGRGY